MQAESKRPLDDVVKEARAILRGTIAEYQPEAVVGLYSGGNDSTVLLDITRDLLTHVGHANTTVGIEETREFVRRTTADYFDLPLIEVHPPVSYRDIVLKHGFPGPPAHWLMYARLKERALRKIRRQFVTNGRKQRIVFVTGVRQDESDRRFRNVGLLQREGSTVWCSPLVSATNAEMADYREAHPDLPRNEVSDHLHMSGECLCGAYAKPFELAEIAFFYPDTARMLVELEEEVRDRWEQGLVRDGDGDPVDEAACQWGWGAYRKWDPSEIPPSGLMCSDCRFYRGQEAKPESAQLSLAGVSGA